MHLVDRMTESPPTCLICGKGNTPDSDGNVGPFLDLERDVNWGDSTYICEDDATKIGAMFGMISPTDVEDLKAKIKAQEKELHDERARYETFKRRTRARSQAILEEVS